MPRQLKCPGHWAERSRFYRDHLFGLKICINTLLLGQNQFPAPNESFPGFGHMDYQDNYGLKFVRLQIPDQLSHEAEP